MNIKNEIAQQLQRYYALWKESNAVYEEWAKAHELSTNSLLVLYSFYDEDEICTQKTISQKWYIPKQTVNTILKDFAERGFIEMTSLPEDKRNKQVRLTSAGKEFADGVMEKLKKKEMYVMGKMGIERITAMNDDLTLFVPLFREGGLEKDE